MSWLKIILIAIPVLAVVGLFRPAAGAEPAGPSSALRDPRI